MEGLEVLSVLAVTPVCISLSADQASTFDNVPKIKKSFYFSELIESVSKINPQNSVVFRFSRQLQ